MPANDDEYAPAIQELILRFKSKLQITKLETHS